eukprot:353547-Chlamydomonas_euryale.AAC.6
MQEVSKCDSCMQHTGKRKCMCVQPASRPFSCDAACTIYPAAVHVFACALTCDVLVAHRRLCG